MTKSTIRSNLSAYIPDIQASHEKGLDYIFGETNSFSCHVKSFFPCSFKTSFVVAGSPACQQHRWCCLMGLGLPFIRVGGPLPVMGVFKWVYARTQVGISRVFFHEGVGYKYDLVCLILLHRPTVAAKQRHSDTTSDTDPVYLGWLRAASATASTYSCPILRCHYCW